MINFYIELTADRKKYRLQADKSTWLNTNSKEITDEDFITPDIYKIIKLQQVDSKIIIEGQECRLNPTSSFLGEKNIYGYEVYVTRDIFPLTPTKEQLVSTIHHGDDRISNSLILNVHGFFELRIRETISLEIQDPTIVVRNETFDSGNDYVGIDAAKDEILIDGLYASALELWTLHLQTGRTNFYCDYSAKKTVSESLNQLEKLEKAFNAKDDEE